MRVALILTARPSYAKLQPVATALLARGIDVQWVVCASALLTRYGAVVETVRRDFPTVPITEVWSTLEGTTLLTTALETGHLLAGLSAALARLKPDKVVVCADRHEVLAAAQAARYLELPLIHLQGGERSGSIDDDVRDAVTQLSSVHCVCTENAQFRVYALTGQWSAVHQTGCPSLDVAASVVCAPPVTLEELGGTGALVDLGRPFVTVLHHPVTSHPETAGAELDATITAARAAGFPVVVFWPGQDAGSEAMSKHLRLWDGQVRAVRSLPPARFLKLLTQSACLVGNSSAGIREGSYLGVPVVNLGDRQQGRERGPNVMDAAGVDALYIALAQQIGHGRYPSSKLYGNGHAAQKIAEVVLGGT